MKNNITHALIALVTLSCTTAAFADSPTTVNFSPYADISINTHWDSQYQDMEPMDLLAISKSSGVRDYHLAFITDAGNCTPAWAGQTNYSTANAWGSHLTDSLRQNGIHYFIAFGGASGNDLSLACSQTQLVAQFTRIIETYQPNGFDFDIENGTANVGKLMHAIKQLQTRHPDLKISFTLPTLPEGLTAEGQGIIQQAKADNINYSVNIMAMDYGSYYAQKSMGEYAIDAATNLWRFMKTLYPNDSDTALWQKVEVTPMIGVNDVNTEQFTLTDVDTLRRFAQEHHLLSLAMWSVARDKPCADRWASPVCSGGNLQTKPYEFSERFLMNE